MALLSRGTVIPRRDYRSDVLLCVVFIEVCDGFTSGVRP